MKSVPLLVALVVLSATSVRADVEYSNLGPGDGFSQNNVIINGPNFVAASGYNSVANAFTASFTGTLSSVELALVLDATVINLYLNDPTTNLPLAASRLTLGATTFRRSGDPGLLTLAINGPTAPLVLAGQTYWLEVAPGTTSGFSIWYGALNPQANPAARSGDGSQTFTAYNQAEAFRINATPAVVPEPGTWALLTLGGVALVMLRQARGTGTRRSRGRGSVRGHAGFDAD